MKHQCLLKEVWKKFACLLLAEEHVPARWLKGLLNKGKNNGQASIVECNSAVDKVLLGDRQIEEDGLGEEVEGRLKVKGEPALKDRASLQF